MRLKVQSIFVIVFFLNVFNPLFNAILRSFGYFGFLSVFRDVGIITLFLILFFLKKVRKDDFYILIVLLLFVFIYILQSVYQGKLYIGFSFIRVFVFPVLFLAISYKILLDYTFSSKQIKNILIVNIYANIVSLIIILLFYVKRELVLELYSLKGISGGWLLIGAKIFRAGWPIGGPNQLGILTASFFIIHFILISEKQIEFISKWKFYFMFIMNTIVLLLTFSRSSWLFLFTFIFIYLFFYKKKIKLRTFIASILLIISGMGTIFYFYRDAFIIWIKSMANSSDLSSQGHLDSFINALLNLNEYFLFGYTKGTVGPRAHIYGGKMYNVENTFLLSLMDFGIFAFILYYFVVLILLAKIIKTSEQLIFVIAVGIPFMLLPYNQDMETLINVSFFILLIGVILKGKESTV